MTVSHQGIVFSVDSIELLGVLHDQIELAAITGDVRNGFLQNRHLAQARQLVQHEQEPVFVSSDAGTILELHAGTDTAHDHIKHKPHQGTHPIYAVWRCHKIQVQRRLVVHEVMDMKIRAGCVDIDDGVPINGHIDQRRRQDAGGFILRLCGHFAGRAGYENMTGLTNTGVRVRSELPKQHRVIHDHHLIQQFRCCTVRIRHHQRQFLKRRHAPLPRTHNHAAMQDQA